MRSSLLAIASAVALTACVADPGTQPHDMSVAQHEAMAKGEDQSAAGHAAQFDPKASVEQKQCGSRWRGGCWTSTVNPTAAHLADAERHRLLAAEHRAASQALRDAEARACVGLADADRDMSPFAHREDIASVQPVTTKSGGGKSGPSGRMTGAVVALRAVPGMTAQWLQRVIDCHVARIAPSATRWPRCRTARWCRTASAPA
jgi:hypothetical protein